MTPQRLVGLVARALGRPGTRSELLDWQDTLGHTRDDDGDAALAAHRASSPHPPTPADVRRHAVAIANDRAMREETARRRVERETGMTADGRRLVPMPPEVRAAARRLSARQAEREAVLAEEAS